MFNHLKHRSSSTKIRHEKLRQIHTADFVLAYKRRRKSMVKEDGSKLDDETERQRFYNELRAQGILVNVDDDPTVSIIHCICCKVLLKIRFETYMQFCNIFI
jgi:hypothetical protein